jgi:polyisoprenoid-binding protein YceI
MLTVLFSLITSLLGFVFPLQQLSPVDNESQVKFVIKNFGLTVNGSFRGLEGVVIFDPADLRHSNFAVSIKASTINTGNVSRDNHLKKADYFDVIHFPTISFKSISVTTGEQRGTFLVTGILQIKDSKKELRIPFTAKKLENGYAFSVLFSINRSDFGVGGSSISLSDNLTVSLAIITK